MLFVIYLAAAACFGIVALSAIRTLRRLPTGHPDRKAYRAVLLLGAGGLWGLLCVGAIVLFWRVVP